MKKLITLLLIIIATKTFSQKQKLELFSKNAISFYSPAPSQNLILDNEISLYINSFGNTFDCGNDTSFGACIFGNIITIFSAFEVSAGFDTFFGNFDSPTIQPKISFYLRPFYYTKIGATFSTKHPSFNFGFTIPIKNIMIELLYKDVKDYNENFYSESFNLSRYQIGIMIPLN
ncbi:hypothetical protein [Tenacibaculum crassostreae]|uniref:hypothetical protein n=1 Tax=Tenacibaculum crassostreae TaxID=502683 RepID=UPI003894F672